LAVVIGHLQCGCHRFDGHPYAGLSAVITGLIVLWDKYSDAQEAAAEKAKERVKIESDGRSQMIKTRFEIENTTKSLKDFTGSKEQEKAKVEELNRKYGESFGYYNTVAEWYDVLIQKSDDYIQMLFLQAKGSTPQLWPFPAPCYR